MDLVLTISVIIYVEESEVKFGYFRSKKYSWGPLRSYVDSNLLVILFLV